MFGAAAYCVVMVAFRDHYAPGVHLVFELDTEAARDERAAGVVPLIEAALARDHIAGRATARDHGQIAIHPDDPARLAEIEREIGDAMTRVPCDSATACFQTALAPDLTRQLLDRALTSTRERVDEKGAAATSVYLEGDAIAVELVGLSRDAVADAEDVISRTAKLEMKVVDDCGAQPPRCTSAVDDHLSSDYMKRLYAHVYDHRSTLDHITAEIDSWRPEAG